MRKIKENEFCSVRIEHVVRVHCIGGTVEIFTVDGHNTALIYDDRAAAIETYNLIRGAMRDAGTVWRHDGDGQAVSPS